MQEANNTNEELNVNDISATEVEVDAECLGPEETEVDVLKAEVDVLKADILRLYADMDNQRKRYLDEIEKAQRAAIQKFSTELVTVKDYLEMALLDNSGQIDTLKMGVTMTLKQLSTAFENAAIKEVCPKSGDKLDPHQHQAMSSEESAEQEANTVVRVLQKGYVIKDRVLRPAMVVVAKAPAVEA